MNNFSQAPWKIMALALFLILAGCDKADKPIRVGFIGGLSSRNLDVGESGYRAVMVAVEQVNRNGGVNGRLVVIEPKDDAQNKEAAEKSAKELIAARVDAVIGPFTSGMATAVVPHFDQAGILLISPTISSTDYYGKDDSMVRINRTTRDNARDYARMLYGRGQKHIVLAVDMRNRAFTESWHNEFQTAMAQHAGTKVERVDYESSDSVDFAAIVQKMLNRRPDGLLFVCGALDAARLAQHARNQAPNMPISACEWAGTEQLLDLGGKVVEGLLIAQNFNREDDSPRYVAFREAFYRRFQTLPGYSSVMAYDAATVLFTALRKKSAKETPKQAVLKYGPYQGLHQAITFDANGDTERMIFFAEIHNGQFRVLH
jgi:branched-chain amino acid transport system substrate-binding protein